MEFNFCVIWEFSHRVVLTARLVTIKTFRYTGKLLCLLVLLPDQSTAADPIRLYGNKVIFDVYRNSDLVGFPQIKFKKNNSVLCVQSQFELAIQLLFFEAYRFVYHSQVFWKNEKLLQFEEVRIGTTMSICSQGKVVNIKVPIYPTNH